MGKESGRKVGPPLGDAQRGRGKSLSSRPPGVQGPPCPAAFRFPPKGFLLEDQTASSPPPGKPTTPLKSSGRALGDLYSRSRGEDRRNVYKKLPVAREATGRIYYKALDKRITWQRRRARHTCYCEGHPKQGSYRYHPRFRCRFPHKPFHGGRWIAPGSAPDQSRERVSPR